MMKEALLRFRFTLKHQEGSTQHETLLVASPGSLHMSTTIENISSIHTGEDA